MEAVAKELRKDAQLGVFMRPDCNVSAIASEIVAKDSAATTSASADHARQRTLSLSAQDAAAGASSHSEQFIRRIDDAVRQIDRVITDHVSEHHSALLARVGSVDGLQDEIAGVQSSVQHVKHAVYELEATVRQHHDKLASDIRKHRNVEQCGELLRRLLRFHQLSERVVASGVNGASPAKDRHQHHHQMNSEMVSTAMAIREIEALTSDPQFEDLTVVRQAMPSIRRVAMTIRRDVRNCLMSGIQRLSQADIGDALQILFCLGSLSDTVQTAVNDVIQDVERKCGAAIAEEMLVSRTVAAPGSNGGAANPGQEAVTVQKADVWKAIHDVFDCLRTHALQVWNLQRVLAKMTDAVSGRNYLEMVIQDDEPTLFSTFWEVSSAIVRELFSSTLEYRAAVKMVLIASYPRMRDEANRMLDELHVATSPKGDETALGALDGAGGDRVCRGDALRPIGDAESERKQLLEALGPLGDAFMERSFRRLSNPIQMMFPQSSNFHTSPPSRSDMQTLARTVYAELDQAGRDPVLLEQIIQQVRKSSDLFCSNSLKIMNTGKAATAVTPSCGRTASQAHNVALLNALQQLDEMVGEVETRLASTVRSSSTSSQDQFLPGQSSISLQKHIRALIEREVVPSHVQIRNLQNTILGQYLQALAALLEGVFSRMHDESFADLPKSGNGRSQSATAPTGGSRYMADFNSTFGVIVEDHLRRLPSAPCVTECLRDFVSRVMSVFIRHASLLRPLEENGKLRLANDMAQLELRLESVVPLRSLGACYEELRAFRHMMFLDSSKIVRDSMVDKIRPSNVWHHLITRAPIELQLPHQLKRWSAAKYVEWMNTSACSSTEQFSFANLPLGHPALKDPKYSIAAEKEVWKEVVKCLDAYAQRLSAVPEAEVSPIYELLQDSGSILLAGYELVVFK